MLERLKQYPLVGLSLAIAAGVVLGGIALRLLDLLWERLNWEWTESNNYDPVWTTIVILAGLAPLIVWKRRHIRDWFRSHKKSVVYAALVFLGLYSALVLRALFVS